MLSIKQHYCALFFVLLVSFTSIVGAATGQKQTIAPGQIPEGLTSSEWTNIQSQITAKKYWAYQNDKQDYQAANPVHGWQIQYTKEGTTTLSPTDQSYQIGLTLTGVGYAGANQALPALSAPQAISQNNNIVDYHWNDNVTERWINSDVALEQWFLLDQRPERQSDAVNQPLTLQLTIDTELAVSQHGNTLQFVTNTGNIINYNKLKVWDSTGQVISAEMQLTGKQLSLLVDDNNAHYPLTIDPSFVQEIYLKASNTDVDDLFGALLAIDGDTIVVAALEDSNATGVNGDEGNNSAVDSGAAYVFVRSGSSWIQQAYLKASNTEEDDFFGNSVAISGDTIVVSSLHEASNATGVNGDDTDNSVTLAGAAYVFVRSGTTWTQQAYLKASNTGAIDRFGASVSISGDTIVVGAEGERSNATGVNGDQSNDSAVFSGAAYVFVRSGTVWSQQAYLKASNPDSSDLFGKAVAISGDTIVVGAYAEDSNATGVNGIETDNSLTFAGAAYVFTRSGSTWSQQAYLKASNTDSSDSFGWYVGISGDTIAVGARLESSNASGVNGDQSDNSANDTGAVYVFTRSGSTWSQQAYLKASNPDNLDRFGTDVVIAGDTIVVGAANESSNATGVNGDDSDNSAADAGAAYVFTRSGSTWSQQDYLKASNTEAGDWFSTAVAVSGDTVIVGSLRESSNATGVNGDQSDNSVASAGAVYIFNLQLTAATAIPMLSLPLLLTLILMIGLLGWFRFSRAT